MTSLSVIIPTYNAEAFIERTLKSIDSQTCKAAEIIIVDDGSTDRTVEVISRYKEISHLPILIIKNRRSSGGPAQPTNAGIMRATGDLLAFLDHDDEWAADKLEKTIALFNERSDIGAVGSDITIINENINKEGYFKHPSAEPAKETLTELIVGDVFFTSFSHLTIRKECAATVGLLDESLSLAADHDYWLRVSLTYKVFLIPSPLTIYRLHKNNTSVVLRKTETLLKDSLILMGKHGSTYTRFPLLHSKRLESIADLYALIGDRTKSILYFRKSIKASPLRLRPYVKLAIVLFSARLFQKIKKI